MFKIIWDRVKQKINNRKKIVSITINQLARKAKTN